MKKTILMFASAVALTVGLSGAALTSSAMAQEQSPAPPPVALPQNIPYPGTMQVTVDATDLDHKVFSVHQVVPVAKAGDLVMMLPKWLPGHHSPGTDIGKLAGLMVSIGGKRVEWTRDLTDMNAFHIPVPQGAKTVEIDFKYLSATTPAAGRTVMTQEMISLQWNSNSLYPAGYYAKQIPTQVTVRFPAGWGYATGMETETKTDSSVTFKVTDYDTVMDSPLILGKYFKTWDITPAGTDAPVRLNVAADRPEQLNASDAVITIHKNLIVQAYKLYQSHHYNHYDFLVTASDNLGGIGLEHHRSSEDGVKSDYLTDFKKFMGHDLLAHEYTHSWDGKFRRAADLWTPNFQVPMRDSLMWVYEGQTQYWGYVLAARSGLLTKEQTLQALAAVAASYDNLPAREWRALQDTTNDPIISSRAPQNWRSYQRSEDYYSEGQLIWLDADTLIREKTKGKKSLDDFAAKFFGIKNGDWGEATYTFEDVVADLNSVYPYDWATFLRTRLDGHGEPGKWGAPLDGFARGGYKVAYVETPSDYYKAGEGAQKATNLTYSIGLSIANATGMINSVLWGSPAFKAGMAPGGTILALNGKAFDGDALKTAITAAKTGKDPIVLLVKVDDNYRTFSLDYHDGLRYPVLQRIEGTPAYLDDILAEKK